MFYDDKMYIMFNDELKNEGYDFDHAKKAPRKFNDRKKMNLILVTIDKDGNANYSNMGNSETMETTVDIVLTKQISQSRMMLCGYKNKNDEVKLGTATFE